MSCLLSVNHLTKIYGCGPREVRALWDVNFALEEGSFTAVLGEAGSGKSALLDILGGLEAPTHGRYQFRGEEVTRMGSAASPGCGGRWASPCSGPPWKRGPACWRTSPTP